MVGPLLIGGAVLAAKQFGLLGKKSSKGGKIFDLTSGIIGDVVLGMGAGAVVNYLDGMTGGNLQRLYVGKSAKGQNLNAADAVVIATTVGLGGFSGKNMQRTAAILAGKKVGEYTGAIDPIDFSAAKSPTPATGYQPSTTSSASAWGYGRLTHS